MSENLIRSEEEYQGTRVTGEEDAIGIVAE